MATRGSARVLFRKVVCSKLICTHKQAVIKAQVFLGRSGLYSLLKSRVEEHALCLSSKYKRQQSDESFEVCHSQEHQNTSQDVHRTHGIEWQLDKQGYNTR